LHTLHGLDGCGHEVTIVADRYIATFFEFEGRVLQMIQHNTHKKPCQFIHPLFDPDPFHSTYNDHFLSTGLTESLSPAHLSRITLHFEVLVTLGATESEGLDQKRRISIVTIYNALKSRRLPCYRF
jgi:hypothetical protein